MEISCPLRKYWFDFLPNYNFLKVQAELHLSINYVSISHFRCLYFKKHKIFCNIRNYFLETY